MTTSDRQLREVAGQAFAIFEQRACQGIIRLGTVFGIACLPWIAYAPAPGVYQLSLTVILTVFIYWMYRKRLHQVLHQGKLVTAVPTSGFISIDNMFNPGGLNAPIHTVKLNLSMSVITLIFHLLSLPTLMQAYRLRVPVGERGHSYVLYEDMRPLKSADGRYLVLVLPGLWMLPPSPAIVLFPGEHPLQASALELFESWLAEQSTTVPAADTADFPYRLLIMLGVGLYLVSLLLMMPLVMMFGWFVPAILAFIIGFPILVGCLRMRYGDGY